MYGDRGEERERELVVCCNVVLFLFLLILFLVMGLVLRKEAGDD